MSALDLIGQIMTQAVLPAAGTALSGLAVNYVRKLTKKANIEIGAQEEAAVRRLVLDGLKMAEERGRRENLTGEQKRALVLRYLAASGPSMGGRIDPSQAEHMIDATLPDLRAEQALIDPPPLADPPA